jgi:alkylation response protein AidB-like acyl-CoA dehydrogenase
MTMTSLAADERAALRDAMQKLLADRCTEADVRRTMETESGFDADLWRQLAEMGITGLIVDPEYGGAGAGPLELEAIMEEAGSALLCGPLLASSVLAAGLLDASGDADAKARLLPGIASGDCIATVALTGGARNAWTPAGVAVTATGDTLSGAADFVLHANLAHVLLVVARTANGLGVFEVDPKAAGVSVKVQKTLDLTLRLCKIEFNNAAARQLTNTSWDAVETALNLTRVALAGEQAGGAERIFNITVEYISNRIQFGRAIGGFQAIKHMAADLLIEKESAISAARAAAQALADNAADKDTAINLAAFACADAYHKIAFDSIQMHGGIAYTWVCPAHLYLRRARADQQLFGDSNYYRERYVANLGG